MNEIALPPRGRVPNAMPMQIRVKFFAILRDQAGVSQIELELNNQATVEDAHRTLRQRYPNLDRYLQRAASAVNQEYVSSAHLLRDGDELALIPPVSGG